MALLNSSVLLCCAPVLCAWCVCACDVLCVLCFCAVCLCFVPLLCWARLQVFASSEMFARVCVAVLMHQFARQACVPSTRVHDLQGKDVERPLGDSWQASAAQCGEDLLMLLLTSAVSGWSSAAQPHNDACKEKKAVN